jgi:hypothetical protein
MCLYLTVSGVSSAPSCVADVLQEIDIGACFYSLQLRYLLIVLTSVIDVHIISLFHRQVVHHVRHNVLSPTFVRRLILVRAFVFVIGIPVNCAPLHN